MSVDAEVLPEWEELGEGGERFIQYDVEVTLLNNEQRASVHSLRKRFADFFDVHSHLRIRFSPSALPHLPSKTIRKHYSDKNIAPRRRELDRYLKECCCRSYIVNDSAFRDFLELHRFPRLNDTRYHISRLPLVAINEEPLVHADPVQECETGGVVFGINSFVCVPNAVTYERDVFLAISSDTSLFSRGYSATKQVPWPWKHQAPPKLYNGMLSAWRVSEESLERESYVMFSDEATALAYDRHHQRVFVGTSGGEVHVVRVDPLNMALTKDTVLLRSGDMATGEADQRDARGGRGGKRVTAIVVDPVQNRVYVSGWDRTVFIFSATDFHLIETCSSLGKACITSMTWVSSSSIMFLTSYEPKLIEADCTPGTVGVIDVHHSEGGSLRCIAHDAATGCLYTGGYGGKLTEWSTEGGVRLQRVLQCPSRDFKLKALCVMSNVRMLCTGGDRGFCQLWLLNTDDAKGDSCVFCWKAHQGTVTHVQWLPQRQSLLTSGADGHMKAWRLHTSSLHSCRVPLVHSSTGDPYTVYDEDI